MCPFVQFSKASSSEYFLNEYEKYDGLLNISQDASMERIMNELFRMLKIENAVWQLSKNTKFYQITFSVESNARHELVLSTFNEWGIGQRNGSCMSMIPCAIFNQPSKQDDFDPKTEYVSPLTLPSTRTMNSFLMLKVCSKFPIYFKINC